MKKLFGIGVVVMLAAVAPSASYAINSAAEWSCNTTCRDTRGFEYIQVSYGCSADQAYQNLNCREGDTVSGDINCDEELLLF